MRKFSVFVSFIFIVFIYFFTVSTPVHAASVLSLSDTITTSRPSAAAPLDFDITNASGSAIIKDVNANTIFIASDSAVLQADTGETQNSVIVASSSGIHVPIQNDRTVYFTAAAANSHHKGDTLYVPVTAMHTISFQTIANIPANGKIVLTFPGSGISTATPSASTFSFNGLASGQITYNLSAGRTCSFTISAPTITCTVDAGGSIPGGTTLTFILGCTTASPSATCSTQAPRLINPTKAAAVGTSDTWAVSVTTQDASSATIDTGKTKINTIDSVRVFANVDASLTFAISAINSGTAISGVGSSSCTAADTTNSGSTDPSSVDLGTLSSASLSIAGQYITITTNGSGGYSLTATSSGHLINPATGFWITDSNGGYTPGMTIFAGQNKFGVRPCGLDVNSTNYGTSSQSVAAGGGGKIAWPLAGVATSGAILLASDSTGPVGNSLLAGNGITTLEYAASVDPSVPAGNYLTAITYVATATF